MYHCKNDKPCNIYDCRHNIFWSKLKWKSCQTEKATEIGNCMLRLNDNDFLLEDIARVYGMSRERIRQIEEKALLKLIKILINRGELEKHEVKQLREQLEYFQQRDTRRRDINRLNVEMHREKLRGGKN